MMEPPLSFTNNSATVTCSTCHRDIDIGLIAEHACTAQPPPAIYNPGLPYPSPGIPQVRPPPSPADSTRGLPPRGASLHLKPGRPILPKIDSSFAWQSGELTPASSGHGSVLASPASTGSSRRSPSKPRKPSVAQRPPSPELISQDCAFPPFPGMTTSKPKSSSKDRGVRSRKETGKTKLATSTTSSPRSSRHVAFDHSRTPSANSAVTTATRGRTKSITGDDYQTRPTTAPESHSDLSSHLTSDIVPPLPRFSNVPPPLTRADTAPVAPLPPPASTLEPPLTRQVTFDSILPTSGSSSNESSRAAEMAAFGNQSNDFQRPPLKEPAYKSKRPPPIASNLGLPSSPHPSKSPSPGSARSLGRTLTEKLFGRKPSTGRRSMVRAALSDEPEPMPVPPLPISGASSANEMPPRPARSPEYLSSPNDGSPPRPSRPSIPAEPLFTNESSTLRSASPPLAVSEEAERERQASLAALGGANGVENSAPLPQPVSEDLKIPTDDNTPTTDFDFGLGISNVAERAPPEVSVERASISSAQADGARIEIQDQVVESRRASIDSASSYGSIGFTERTFSSRSSPPPAEEGGRKRSGVEARVEADEGMIAMPAPLRPREVEAAADSPTDPLFIDGRLSPILGKERQEAAVSPSIDAQVVQTSEPRSSLDQIDATINTKSETQDTADPVPAPLFRPRKESLASSQRPLFQRSSAENEPLPSPPTDVSDTAKFRARKDSLASVGGRRAGTKGTCRGCSQPILATQKSVSSADGRLSGKYHKECFVCRTCREPFATAEFYVHADQPYCAHHYHKLSDSLCATCGKGIEGLYMETANVAGRGKEKHHPACLKCATCRVQLTNDYFELSGKVYCERDAFRLASHPRVHSRGPARPSPLVREYIRSGDPGAIRGANFPERRTNRPMLDVR